MRKVFVEQLEKEMKVDKKIILLTADLGYRVFENIKNNFPKQFINVGVAEANMVGVAAGLAANGFKLYIYSITPFITSRVLEQIKLSICYDDFNVKIIGVGGGYNYGAQGISHHSIEDIACMRALPNMSVVCPAYEFELKAIMPEIIKYKHPLFLRIGKNLLKLNKQKNIKFGQANIIKNDGEIALLSSGNILNEVILLADILKKQNINSRIISFPFIKPLDKKILAKLISEVKAIFTFEEAGCLGGFGSAVAEFLAESQSNLIFKIFGIPDYYIKEVGSQDYLRKCANLKVSQMANKILQLI